MKTEQQGGRDERADDFAVDLLRLFLRVEPLKHLPRTGWVDREVDRPESVAAHSWRLALMAWLLADRAGLDAGYAIRLALVHDLAEAITGDLTPFDEAGQTPEARRALATNPPEQASWGNLDRHARKVAAERLALDTILQDVPPPAAMSLRAAWEDYEAGTGPEARLVRQLDKLEAYLQGCEYARDGRLPHPETLNSFRLENQATISDPAVRAVLLALEHWLGHAKSDPVALRPDATQGSETP